MTALQILRILLARFWVVMTIGALVIGAGVTAVLKLPKTYTASASVLVDARSQDPVSAIIDRGSLPHPGQLGTQVDILKSERVALRVVAAIGLDKDAVAREQWTRATDGRGSFEAWLAEGLGKRLSTKTSAGGAIISIEFEDGDPDRAAAVANAYARALIETNIAMKVDQARQYSQWFEAQSRLLRENLDAARARLSSFQQAKGIIARDESLDSETIKLQDLSARLTRLQAETAEARSKQRSAKAGELLPEVTQNPLIAALAAELVRQEVKLKELGSNLGTNHPQYQRASAEVEALKRRIDIESRKVVSGLTAKRDISRENEAELKAALQAQEKKVLLLKTAREELGILRRDVEVAQASYDAVSKRYAQVSLESRADQTNVSVFSAAVPPTVPSGPRVVRIMLGAIVLGMLLGAGAAIGLEMLDPRVRAAEDVVEMLHFPLLAVIPHGKALRGAALAAGPGTPRLR